MPGEPVSREILEQATKRMTSIKNGTRTVTQRTTRTGVSDCNDLTDKSTSPDWTCLLVRTKAS